MRVLICGDRNWIDFNIIKRELSSLPAGTVIIHGAARGADSIAGYIAKQLGFEVIPFKADWDKYKSIAINGRKNPAGPIRNQRMLDEGRPDYVMAFHKHIETSLGTKDMITRAQKAGLKVVLIST